MLFFGTRGYLVVAKFLRGEPFFSCPHECTHCENQAEDGGTDIGRNIANPPNDAKEGHGESSHEPPPNSRTLVRVSVKGANDLKYALQESGLLRHCAVWRDRLLTYRLLIRRKVVRWRNRRERIESTVEAHLVTTLSAFPLRRHRSLGNARREQQGRGAPSLTADMRER
ncbi:hypothetical protein [Rhodococcus opacus]|uniref:hypothetical protein n=1 Tax=Rhodococcus opacus TaxID=37919 RepID=UPI0034D1790B